MRISKLFFTLAMITILSIIAVGCSSSSSSSSSSENESTTEDKEETITLKLATYFANNAAPHGHIIEPWTNRVTELTDGKVQFELYPAEQLGKASDLLQLTKGGTTDISMLPANYYEDEMPLNSMLAGLPNLHENSYQGTMAYNDLIQNNSYFLENEILKHGVKPILGHVSPPYELFSNHEIRIPEDIKGLKTRTPGGVGNEYYDFLGATSVAVSFSELYEALEKGVIEAASIGSTTIKSAGVEDVISYGVEARVGSAINLLLINEGIWNNLPEDVQNAMIQAADEVKPTSGHGYNEDANNILEEFSKENTVVELTEEERELWNNVNNEFIEFWLENTDPDVPYAEILEEYRQYLDEYR